MDVESKKKKELFAAIYHFAATIFHATCKMPE